MIWKREKGIGFGVRQNSVQTLAHHPCSHVIFVPCPGSTLRYLWNLPTFREILFQLVVPIISCYIESYHGELFGPVLVRIMLAAETNSPQLLVAYDHTGLFSP